MKQKIDSLQEGQRILVEFLNSDEGMKQVKLSLLRQRPLVLLLRDIAVQIARTDGWASMNKAGQLIKQHAPEEVALLNQRYGYKTLKGLIVGTEIFEILEEPTDKGFRILYK